MTETPPPSGRAANSYAKAFTLVGCGIVWLGIGLAVLAATSMFLVNPRVNGGAWMAGMFVVWLMIFIVIARSIFRDKEF